MNPLSMSPFPLPLSQKYEGNKSEELSNWMMHLERAWLANWPSSSVAGITESQPQVEGSSPVPADLNRATETLLSTTQSFAAQSLRGANSDSPPTDSFPAESERATFDQQGNEVAEFVAPRSMVVGNSSVLKREFEASVASALVVKSDVGFFSIEQQVSESPKAEVQTNNLLPVSPPVGHLIRVCTTDAENEQLPNRFSSAPCQQDISQPYKQSLLRVSVNEAGVQVTLRDAALSHAAALYAGTALAQELRSRGAEGLRVYVNGLRLSQLDVHPSSPVDFLNKAPLPLDQLAK
ncbi:hypothetical protein [Paucibacter sp. KBW04]|uniref:hypothetical protein n=1 Tax=Paucibacter sp. KBW04 TaxID=2153361 RepID=UPI000F55B028|nr:hypothetical protein [Paucibacter sp. KBW04]